MNIKIKAGNELERWRVSTFYEKEPETLAWIKDFEGGVFWDIGANIGVYTLWCGHQHPGMVVHAFEPMRKNFLRLWQNISLNEHARTTAHFAALGATGRRHAVFRIPEGKGRLGDSGGQIDRYMSDACDEYMVPVVCGDDFCCAYGQPDYIKIDTDANEYDILCGMTEVLASRRLKSVLVEINYNEKAIYEIMQAAGLFPDVKYNSLKDRDSDHNIIFSRRDVQEATIH